MKLRSTPPRRTVLGTQNLSSTGERSSLARPHVFLSDAWPAPATSCHRRRRRVNTVTLGWVGPPDESARSHFMTQSLVFSVDVKPENAYFLPSEGSINFVVCCLHTRDQIFLMRRLADARHI